MVAPYRPSRYLAIAARSGHSSVPLFKTSGSSALYDASRSVSGLCKNTDTDVVFSLSISIYLRLMLSFIFITFIIGSFTPFGSIDYAFYIPE